MKGLAEKARRCHCVKAKIALQDDFEGEAEKTMRVHCVGVKNKWQGDLEGVVEKTMKSHRVDVKIHVQWIFRENNKGFRSAVQAGADRALRG